MSAPLLSLSGVDKRFGGAPVLSGVDLDVAPGELVVLIGGSGSGKTTLLRIVGGLESADGGVVRLRGVAVDEPGRRTFVPPERRGLGMVFQDYALWPHMSALENVEAAMGNRRSGRRQAAQALLDQVGVGALALRRPAQMSGGQQQRVGLARALAAAPDLLLLDEPLSSLDIDVRQRMREQIRLLFRERGAGALFVSHDPTDAWRLADRVAVLERGRIVQAAAPADLYSRPATARVARFSGALGGFPVQVRGRGTSAGFAWADGVQPASVVGVTEGGAGRVYVRPCGVRAGPDGEPARLVDRTFEDGAWRATWRLTARDGTVTTLEPAPPETDARLVLSPEHTFIFPDEEDWP